MKYLPSCVTSAVFALVILSAPAWADVETISGGSDDFGGSYFTAQAPAALADTPYNDLVASDSSAAAVAGIEPAAGNSGGPLPGVGESFDVLDFSGDTTFVPAGGQGQLASPQNPLVPGM